MVGRSAIDWVKLTTSRTLTNPWSSKNSRWSAQSGRQAANARGTCRLASVRRAAANSRWDSFSCPGRHHGKWTRPDGSHPVNPITRPASSAKNLVGASARPLAARRTSSADTGRNPGRRAAAAL
jgi:hypothetical protein